MSSGNRPNNPTLPRRPLLDLGAEGETGWQTLRQHAEWAEGVWFGWVFVASLAAAREMAARFDQLPDPRGTGLVLDLDEHSVLRLFETGATNRRAVWIIGQAPAGAADWERLHLLLNERRERIRRHLSGALIFVGRPEWKETARTAAPDLWSQRTVVLEFAPSHVPQDDDLFLDRAFLDYSYLGTAPSADPALALRGAQRAERRGDSDARAVALTRTANALVTNGRSAEAREAAAQALDLSRTPSTRARAFIAAGEAEAALGDSAAAAVHFRLAGEIDGGLAGDERAMAFGSAGDVLATVGKLIEAREAFGAAERYADSDQGRALAKWSCGQAEYHIGNYTDAARLLTEAAGTYRNLAAHAPANVRTLGDVLTALGATLDSLGDLAGAAAVLSEAVASYRRAAVIDPSNADVRLELGWALRTLGTALLESGDAAGAARAYHEGRGVVEQATDARGGGRATRALMTLEADLADVAKANGDMPAAAEGYERALKVARELVRMHPVDPQALRDLAVTLRRRVGVEPDGSALSAQLLEECLDVVRRRRHIVGEVPDAVGAEMTARLELADVIHDEDARKTAYADVIQLYRDRARTEDSVPQWRVGLAEALGRRYTRDGGDEDLNEAESVAADLVARWPTDRHRHLLRAVRELGTASAHRRVAALEPPPRRNSKRK